jgi:hypothetical protein
MLLHPSGDLPSSAESLDDFALAGTLPLNPLLLLWRAAHYAANAQRSRWEFSIELESLQTLGLCDCDLRWLVAKGYLEHQSACGCAVRPITPCPALQFAGSSKFVLTPGGLQLVRQLLNLAPGRRGEVAGQHDSRPASRSIPNWDQHRRELRIGQALIKRFTVPAENQEVILASFQEEDWPLHLDDPLSPAPGIDAKRRLHSTIQCLNRNQKAPLLRFRGDGYGRGIVWELLAAAG